LSLTTMSEPTQTRVAVFVTAFNEEQALGGVLSGISPSYDVFVVDDGSSDDTARVARQHGAASVSHPINLGQGMAITTAFKLLATRDYDIIIEMDGDGQHDPAEIGVLVNAMEETGADIVAGSRLLGSNYQGAPASRRLLLPPLSFVLRRMTGYKISDFMCGFRAFRREAIHSVIGIVDSMLESEYIASEMWIRFANAGLTATEVPIHLAASLQRGSYKGHALARYGLGIIRTIVRASLEVARGRRRG